MNTNDLNTALYEKMAAEQDKYRDWLKSQPPEEILHHTYEYTIREDIVMAMEELELTDAQAEALLESPSPLADVYRYFEKLETGYMDVIRDSIENRADDVCRAKEELRTTPVYPHSAAYAREHGELEQYRASNNVNLQCKESIEAENTETRGNIQNIPFSHKKYMLLAKYHTKKLFTTETKTNGYHTLHYHHSNFTTILPSVSLFLPFSVTEIRFRDPKGKSMP